MDSMIKVSHLSKTFESKSGSVEALSDVSFEVKKGEIFGIIGLSGAGKSTLVRCLNLLEKPNEGSVEIDGEDMMKLDEKSLRLKRRKIGMIFQAFNLLMQASCLDNVCFPMEIAGVPKAEAREKAMEYLKTVGLEEKAHAYPVQLSGGQKQRVAIARALACDPRIILCDEATSALDPRTTGTILELLKKINREYGITIVVITHEMRVVREICHRVAVLDRGRVQECGPVEEIFTNPQTDATRRLLLMPQEEIGEEDPEEEEAEDLQEAGIPHAEQDGNDKEGGNA